MLTLSEREEEGMILENWMLWVMIWVHIIPAIVLSFNDERRRQVPRLLIAGVGLLLAGMAVLWFWQDLAQQIYLGQDWLTWFGYVLMAIFVLVPSVWIFKARKKWAAYEQKFYGWVVALFWVYTLLLGDILNRVSHSGLPELLLKGLLFFCYFMLLNRLVLMLVKSEKGWAVTAKGWFAKRKKKEEPKVAAPDPAKTPPATVRKTVPRKAAPATTGTPPAKPATTPPRRVRPSGPGSGTKS